MTERPTHIVSYHDQPDVTEARRTGIVGFFGTRALDDAAVRPVVKHFEQRRNEWNDPLTHNDVGGGAPGDLIRDAEAHVAATVVPCYALALGAPG